VTLKKLVNDNWPSLEGDGSAAYHKAILSSVNNDEIIASSSRPKAYASHRNWDSLGSEIAKELEAEKPEGEQALQKVIELTIDTQLMVLITVYV
jgi:hypothetical protein